MNINTLTITTLIENNPDTAGKLSFEHGLSLYIEFEGHKILFDTGQSEAFIQNAEKLGKSLSQVDTVVLSHGHYDHSGGVMKLTPFLQENTPVYIGEGYFTPKYKKLQTGEWKFNGNSFSENDLEDTGIKLQKVTDDITYITEHIILFKNFQQTNTYEKQNPKFYKKRKDYILDDFSDEIVLGIVTQKGLVIIAGCSHVGIINILEGISERMDVPIYSVLGGTHLVEADQDRLKFTTDAFKKMKIKQIAVSHCTGKDGIETLKNTFGKDFIINNTGNIFTL